MRKEAAWTTMATVALTLAACDAETIATPDLDVRYESTVEMVAICHLNAQTGAFQLLLPATGMALEKHLAHGDLMPGDPLPGGNGTIAADCSGPVLPMLAIAFTDVDPDDGAGYKEGVDLPISALFDANGDGSISVGDEVRVYGFPVDFDASAFGSVSVSSHTVAGVLSTAPDYVVVGDANGGLFYWMNRYSWESYFEEDADGWGTLVVLDSTDGTALEPLDRIETVFRGEPSLPDRTLSLTDAAATDDAFLDIEITITP